ncbi:phosphoribosyltransferase [Amycolatopsis pigmentata]|uniref:Phosphoribosyltransferase n=1 Tax=Amycolatopsis pigmentata TaxID=450801 RepID=A0ABW5G530_9PSEU
MSDTTIALDLTWTELKDHVATLAEGIRQDGIPQVVIGILRGGMVPAVLLAHRLGVRDVRGIEVTRTLTDEPNGAKTAQPQVVNPASLGTFGTATDVLLVDDVAGSGETLATAATLITGLAARVRRAVVVVNTINWGRSNSKAPQQIQDYIGTTCVGWVRFPWEVR